MVHFDQFQVRKADLADMDVLVQLMEEFYAESAHKLDRQWARASFSSLLADQAQGCAILVVLDHEPVGYAVLSVRHSMEYGGLVAYIDDLYVKPKFRRQGAGSALMAALESESRARGCRAIHVEADESNAGAMALYKKYGLQKVSDGRVLMSAPLPREGA